jgi:hypothetical protein
MTNNFLISLRNDWDGHGNPGTKLAQSSTYIEIPETATTYNLQKNKIDSPDQWLGEIAGTSAITDTSVLVFVHGYDNDATKVVARHNAIKPNLPPGFTLVSFDWPAGNPHPTTYDVDKGNALASAPNLISDCLQVLLRMFRSSKLHLLAHSMGAYVTETAFKTPKATQINHVMMAAADVDRLNYRADSPSLQSFLSNCSGLSAYWSQDDEALMFSVKEKINKGAVPLGLKGFPDPQIPDGCSAIECTGYYETYVENTGHAGIPKKEFSHVWYLLYPIPPTTGINSFYTDMREVLQDSSTSPTRTQTGYERLRSAVP